MNRDDAPVLLIGGVRAAWSDASSSDLRPTSPAFDRSTPLARWATQVTGSDRPGGGVAEVQWLDQVHGNTVVVSRCEAHDDRRDDGSGAGSVSVGPGDGLVASDPSIAVAVLTADCASVALASHEGHFAAVHAGWRGLVSGVIAEAVASMRAMGATEVTGALGPCIHPECYEFSEVDLALVEAVHGPGVAGRTSSGRPALDVPATVSAALVGSGVTQVVGTDACTACAGHYFSHRARGDRGRQALVVWSIARTGAER